MAEHDLQSIAFPTLDEAQIARLSGCTASVPRSYQDGQTLFAVGDRDMKFFIVKSGEVEIIDYSGDEPKQVTVHRQGQFTGEVAHLTGASAVVTAIARGRCEVLEVSGEALRRMLNQCLDLSDIILQAFIARRQLLRQSPDFTGLRVIGSRYSADTFQVRDFLAKNRVLFTWVPVLRLAGGETIAAKCLLIASGAEYRRLGVEGCARYEGKGVYYAATPNEAKLCRGAEVVLGGGGNSAGQAAVFLAEHARKVLLVIRGDDLYKNMSSYLARRTEQTANIELLRNATIRRMHGEDHLAAVEIVNHQTGEERMVETPTVFSFIGAVPRTDWLPTEIERDAKGFVQTGPALAKSPHWTARRQPFLLETSRPGVFAAGDVRAASVKRIASAVGEGAMAVQFVHEYLKEM